MLGLAESEYYHTGITRDTIDPNIWRRISDGQAVEMSSDGWWFGEPTAPKNDNKFIYFYYRPGHSYSGKIANNVDNSHYFVCEHL